MCKYVYVCLPISVGSFFCNQNSDQVISFVLECIIWVMILIQPKS